MKPILKYHLITYGCHPGTKPKVAFQLVDIFAYGNACGFPLGNCLFVIWFGAGRDSDFGSSH